MKASKLEWYIRRLQRMSSREVVWRAGDHIRQRAWAAQQVPPSSPPDHSFAVDDHTGRRGARERLAAGRPKFLATLPPGELDRIIPGIRRPVLSTADEILEGRWPVLGVLRDDIEEPDWFLDPLTRRRAPQQDYCFRIDHRDDELTGDVKHVWELSRLQHVTVLAAAFALSRDRRYADRAASNLRSWWAQNPFLSGVHWTSGIEVGLRLINWVWVRRLLDEWEGAPGLFEENDEALTQIWWHQRYLANFRSRGSSANNHVIAEAAGQLVAALAFDWFEDSEKWSGQALHLLEDELSNNTFPSGVNRELAFDYHGFVAELGLLAAAEADRAGRPLAERTWETLGRTLDVVAAVVDVKLGAPRQGDSDDGRALILGDPDSNRWTSLLALGRALFGAPGWWPETDPDITSSLVASMAERHSLSSRFAKRPEHFADAGLTVMRSCPADGPEIWCRCDGGPHGFLSIAAHAHADALAIEVRHAGVDILADPGTYCYNREPLWRSYFRSTIGHNTLELANQNQSVSGGPTLWMRHARSRVLEAGHGPDGRVERWSAEHDGYATLTPPAWHCRRVELSSARRRITIVDEVRTAGLHPLRLAFHLGPTVRAAVSGATVELMWDSNSDAAAKATLHLPAELEWSLVRGSTDPVLGWYSAHFGEKEPATTVLGKGTCSGGDLVVLRSVLQFGDGAP